MAATIINALVDIDHPIGDDGNANKAKYKSSPLHYRRPAT
jgi:hypothetical protein